MEKRFRRYLMLLTCVCLVWPVLEFNTALAQKKEPENDTVISSMTAKEAQTDELYDGKIYMQIPEIKVTFGEPVQEIPCMAGGYTLVRESKEQKDEMGEPLLETMIACGEDPVAVLWDMEAIPYVDLGSWITVQFRNGTMPDYLIVEDSVLDENGAKMYEAVNYTSEDVVIEQNQMRFFLKPNMNALYSTDPDTYKNGGVTRGIRLKCEWRNGSKSEYAWIFKTDAVFDSDGNTGYGSVTPAGCGTGIPVTSTMESLKKNASGYVMKIQIYNHYHNPYTISDAFTVSRIQGEEAVKLELKEGKRFNEKYRKLGFWNRVPKMDIGKYYGELEPGYYVLRKELIQQETGEVYPLTRSFVIAE